MPASEATQPEVGTPGPGSARASAALDLVLWTAVTAAVTGLLEGSTLQLRDALGYIPWVSAYIGWQAPLAYALYLVPVAVVLSPVAWRFPRLWGWCAAVPISMAALGFTFFIGHYRLHPVAQVILAAGVGTQLALLLGDRRERLRRTGVRILGLGLIAATVNAGAVSIQHYRTQNVSGSADVANANQPNVLLIVLDAVRASSLGVYGYDRPTSPTLDRLAREGVVFDNAFATAPWTLPSHASMFSGRWPHQLSVGWQRALPESVPVLAEELQAAGYRTGGFTANLLYTTRSSGLARGFQHYEGFRKSFTQLMLAPAFGQFVRQQQIGFRSERRLSDRKYASEVVDGFLDWQAQDTSRPFFAFINVYDAHAPYRPPPEWRGRFKSDNAQRDRYDASIAAQDSVLGVMFDSLAARGVLDRTVVVMTADHGELLGEHKLHGHGNSLYALDLHVPLVMRGPGIAAGLRFANPVSLRDLPATLIRAAALDHAPLPGYPLQSLWTEPSSAQVSPVYAEVHPPPNVEPGTPLATGSLRSLIAGRYHAIRHSNGRLEVYDLIADPDETRDLSKDQTMALTIRDLRRGFVAFARSP